jgi:hypothetical protein
VVLVIVVMYELFNPFECARPTVHPRVRKTADSSFEGVKPLFNVVSIIHQTVQS